MNIYDKLSMGKAVQLLNEWTEAYDKGTPIVSDQEWDDLYFELKAAEENLGIVLSDSPTQKINYTVVTELKKVKHEYQPMLSLDKTKDIEVIKRFIGDKDWIAMLKLDGLTCRLTYENGKLVRAETRGGGYEGEDITHNAMVLPSIPKRIPYYDTLVVDGEMICDKTTFEQFKDEYANPRNFAAGSIRLLDSNECAKRGLTFVAWDVITGYEDYDTALNKKLTTLIDYDFTVVPFSMLSFETVIDDLQESNNKYCNYPIDGIVFKYNKNDDYYAAGRTEHHFRGGMAYKFYDEEFETELLDIEWSMGRTGILTPVAIYKEVDTGESVNTRASMHNINIMTELLGKYPHKGQILWIAKMNQINPQVTKSQINNDFSKDDIFYIPDCCPHCHWETEIAMSDSGTQELYCTNPNCEFKLINKLDHFCGKKGLDIKGLSKATLEKLIEWEWISSIEDLFTVYCYKKQWYDKPGFGVKSVNNILNAIDDARECTLEQYLSAISIPLIGKTYARELANIYEDYNTFREAILQGEDFTVLEGFGPEKHDAITNFDYAEADRIIDMGYIKIKENELENSGNSLDGSVFCVTGKLTNFKNRDAVKAYIEQAGGKVTDSVSTKTTYLVNNDINSTSAKNKKAKELNIPIITEEELINMIGVEL